VEGNGQAELVDAIMGIRPIAGGSVELAGSDIGHLSTADRRESGVGFIPEDRHRQGLILEGTLWENRILGHQTRKPVSRGFLVDRAAARADTRRIIEAFDVRTPGIEVTAASLSGGNQQKLIVGREMSESPVLLISADLEELIGMSDRLTVILRGRLTGTYDPHAVTPEQLGAAMTGAGEEPTQEVAS
jgi:simple sugar transport system ATP-binding protein